MPLNMVEILDAPVPFLIGLHSQYLHITPKEKRPQSVVFVDLQNDTVDLGSTSELYGIEMTPRIVENLSKNIKLKLQLKLNEFGGCIYKQKNHIEKIKLAGLAFPNHEQLNPIIDFLSDSALSQSEQVISRPPSPPHHNNQQYSPIKNKNGNNGNLSPSLLSATSSSHLLIQSQIALSQDSSYNNGNGNNNGNNGNNGNNEYKSNAVNMTVLEKLLQNKVAGGKHNGKVKTGKLVFIQL